MPVASWDERIRRSLLAPDHHTPGSPRVVPRLDGLGLVGGATHRIHVVAVVLAVVGLAEEETDGLSHFCGLLSQHISRASPRLSLALYAWALR